VTERQKIQNGGLDHYAAERFGRLIFATVRKSLGLKGLTALRSSHYAVCGLLTDDRFSAT